MSLSQQVMELQGSQEQSACQLLQLQESLKHSEQGGCILQTPDVSVSSLSTLNLFFQKKERWQSDFTGHMHP